MRIKGHIELIETEGRTGPLVKKTTTKDYFLAFKIMEINEKPVSTLGSAFEALKSSFPSVKIGEKEVSEFFETCKLAPKMKDICHLSLAYFVDFRKNRDTANDIDQEKVDLAYEDLHGQSLDFEIEGCPFQVVSTSKNYEHIHTEANLCFAKDIGPGRDTVLNLLPSKKTQEELSKKLACLFGEGYAIRNREGDAVPFHITIGQTDKLNALLAQLKENTEENREVETLRM